MDERPVQYTGHRGSVPPARCVPRWYMRCNHLERGYCHTTIEVRHPYYQKPFLCCETWCSDLWYLKACLYFNRKQGISYYNPQLPEWSTHYIPMEASVKDNCQILLYVISPLTRGITSMLEVRTTTKIFNDNSK